MKLNLCVLHIESGLKLADPQCFNSASVFNSTSLLSSSLDSADHSKGKLFQSNVFEVAQVFLYWTSNFFVNFFLKAISGNVLRRVWKVIVLCRQFNPPTGASELMDEHRCDPKRKFTFNISVNGGPARKYNTKLRWIGFSQGFCNPFN